MSFVQNKLRCAAIVSVGILSLFACKKKPVESAAPQATNNELRDIVWVVPMAVLSVEDTGAKAPVCAYHYKTQEDVSAFGQRTLDLKYLRLAERIFEHPVEVESLQKKITRDYANEAGGYAFATLGSFIAGFFASVHQMEKRAYGPTEAVPETIFLRNGRLYVRERMGREIAVDEAQREIEKLAKVTRTKGGFISPRTLEAAGLDVAEAFSDSGDAFAVHRILNNQGKPGLVFTAQDAAELTARNRAALHGTLSPMKVIIAAGAFMAVAGLSASYNSYGNNASIDYINSELNSLLAQKSRTMNQSSFSSAEVIRLRDALFASQGETLKNLDECPDAKFVAQLQQKK